MNCCEIFESCFRRAAVDLGFCPTWSSSSALSNWSCSNNYLTGKIFIVYNLWVLKVSGKIEVFISTKTILTIWSVSFIHWLFHVCSALLSLCTSTQIETLKWIKTKTSNWSLKYCCVLLVSKGKDMVNVSFVLLLCYGKMGSDPTESVYLQLYFMSNIHNKRMHPSTLTHHQD